MFRLPAYATPFLFAVGLLHPDLSAQGQSTLSARVQAIRYWSFGDVTRIAIQTEGDYKIFSDQIEKPARVYFDLTGLRPPSAARHGVQAIAIRDRLVREIRVAEVSPGRTRIVLDVECPVDVVSSQLVNPDRLMIEVRPKNQTKASVSLARSATGSQKVDLANAPQDSSKGESVQTLPNARHTERNPPPVAVVANSAPKMPDVNQAEPAGDQITSGTHVVVRPAVPQISPSVNEPPSLSTSIETVAENTAATPLVASRESAPAKPASTSTAAPAKRDSAGDRSLVRVFGLKLGRVVIDAGHGGHDTGTIGPSGLFEKDLVLDIALRLGKLITQQLGAEVVYTRSGDVFIPLEQRTKIANNEKADLFISIHANSSPEPSATGVETFYFNLTADKVGLDLATRENASSVSSISDLNDLLHRAVLENKLEESREFAQRIQSALWPTSVRMNSHSRDRGVRQAPFVVLIGASMPSILAEVGFVSNPHDEHLLKRADQRQKIAEALLKGVSQYASSLSHLQIAQATKK